MFGNDQKLDKTVRHRRSRTPLSVKKSLKTVVIRWHFEMQRVHIRALCNFKFSFSVSRVLECCQLHWHHKH